MSHKYTTETFIEDIKKIYIGMDYDYSKVIFINMTTKVEFYCNKHRKSFFLKPNTIMSQKQGCKECGMEKRKHPSNKTTEQFIKQAKEKWKDKKYNYSITIYKNKLTKIKYICEELDEKGEIHGTIEQLPLAHIKNGCYFCSGRGINKHSTESFIALCIEKHGDEYDYSKIEYKNMDDEVIIICKKGHGEFIQMARNHAHEGNGCPKCNGGVSMNTEEFIKKATAKHGFDRLDFSKAIYTGSHNKSKAFCKKHGEYEQLAYMVLQTEYSCPKCFYAATTSKTEEEIKNFITLNYAGSVESHDRTILAPKEIDIYLPELSIGIEYHGCFFHVESMVGKNLHNDKCNSSLEKGVKLIQIYETEWNTKKDIIKSRILNFLNKSKKIYARKCELKSISLEEKNIFLNKNHLQGFDNSSIYYGLFYENNLVACMTFGKPRFSNYHDWELIRYSSELGCNVIGGASRLLSHFIKNNKGSIISYADRRWSTGNLYKKLGFTLDGITEPGYIYYNLKTKEIRNRMACQKHKLINLKGYDESLTEYEIMKSNGFDRIWDAGQYRFILI